MDKIHWPWLSINPTKWAINLLKANMNRISWHWLSSNPAIFKTDQKIIIELARLLHKRTE